jgi:hypothetical protein
MGWVANATPRPLYPPGKQDKLPILQEAVWDPGSVGMDAENLADSGIRSPVSSSRSE